MDKISTITLPDGTKYRLSDNDAQLIKDTVGWTGKNLLKNYGVNTTKSGITMTVNADKSVTVNGTISQDSINFDIFCLADLPDGEFILSGIEGGSNTTYELSLWTRAQSGSGSVSVRIGSPSGRPARLYDDSNPIVFDKNKLYRNSDSTLIDPSNIFVNVIVSTNVSNITFYPMIRRADITDPTYEPYHESVETIQNQLNAQLDQVKSYLGILTTPVPSYVANTLPVLKRNITNAFYNGSLRAEIATGNFKNVRPGDYIIGQATGSTYYVAMCDYRLGKGDQTNNTNYPAYGTHHLGLMLFKPVGTTALWRGYGDANKSWRVGAADLGRCPWNAATDADPTNTEAVGANNTNITRTYNGANVSGYMGSFIRERIDAVLLPQCFQADFGSANVLKYRERNGDAVVTDKPSGGQGNWNGCTSAWNWYDRYLDLPSEVELYGSRIFGSGFDHGCQCEQLPIFRNAAIHDFFPRIDIWLKGVASSSLACHRSGSGNASASSASFALWACPLACVK